MSAIKRTTADKWFSLYVRAKDNFTCQKCNKVFREYIEGGNNSHLRNLECAHLFPRNHKSTRLEVDNATSLCHSCHLDLDSSPAKLRDFFIQQIGKDRVDELRIQSKQPQRNYKRHVKNMSKKFKTDFENMR